MALALVDLEPLCNSIKLLSGTKLCTTPSSCVQLHQTFEWHPTTPSRFLQLHQPCYKPTPRPRSRASPCSSARPSPRSPGCSSARSSAR
eukprot:9109842-Alexandrium_andersonii.AAC.1